MPKIGYLGPAGTFSELAFSHYRQACRLDPVEAVPENQFSVLFEKLEALQLDAIIVPFENSTEGAVSENVDLIIASKDISIVYEILLPVRHALFSKTSDKSLITDIVSHPQALAQCRDYIRKHYPDATLHPLTSTAAQVAYDLGPGRTLASIASETLQPLIPGLTLLDRDIQDAENNVTRFFVLQRGDSPRTDHDKTSIVFSTAKDQPGSLVAALQLFSDRRINLSSISSRPAKTGLGDYLFWIDFDGHTTDSIVKEALDALRTSTPFLKVLGSYPKATTPIQES